MNKLPTTKSKFERGFVIVAACRYVFFRSAVLCAETLRDFYPDAHITLFTHEEWVDDSCDVFDNVVTGIPKNKRAKMWALARTPYDVTMYLDADIQVQDEEISTCFDLLPNDCDMLMTRIRSYSAVVTHFPGGELKWHCGVFLFRASDTIRQLFEDWYHEYNEQKIRWKFDTKLYPQKLQPWDTWTFWKLCNLDGYNEKINIRRFPEDARWNFHNLRYDELNGKSIILYHNTILNERHDERNIFE
jgi:glycosyltransferase involved in cell wall biosynthesis